MATTFSEILTQYAMQQIDDLNWTNELATSPARFLRAKSDTVINAIPRFSRPPEAQRWLSYTAPTYADYLYTAAQAETGPITIATGETGYELCSAVLIGSDAAGNVTNTAIESTYDAATGDVTVQSSLTQGQQVDIDFYTDGVFDNVLTSEQCMILGLCIACTWFGRFSNTWLNMTPKIKDKTFDTGSESAQMTANTAKLKETRLALNDALLRYEQNVFYREKVPITSQLKTPLA